MFLTTRVYNHELVATRIPIVFPTIVYDRKRLSIRDAVRLCNYFRSKSIAD